MCDKTSKIGLSNTEKNKEKIGLWAYNRKKVRGKFAG